MCVWCTRASRAGRVLPRLKSLMYCQYAFIEKCWEGMRGPIGPSAALHTFTGGSGGTHAECAFSRRSGFGLAVIIESPAPSDRVAFFHTLGAAEQTVPRADYLALRWALRLFQQQPAVVHSDCTFVVDSAALDSSLSVWGVHQVLSQRTCPRSVRKVRLHVELSLRSLCQSVRHRGCGRLGARGC